MSRWIDRQEEKEGGGLETGLSRSGSGKEARQRTIPEVAESSDFGDNARERIVLRGREYFVRRSQTEAMFEIGRFRALDAEDLKVGLYAGNARLASGDIRSLAEQRLVKALWIRGEDGKPKQIVSLTKEGAFLLRSRDPRVEREDQVIYAGHVKIAELEHDSLLYRAYMAENRRLRGEGGLIRRIVLDYELKKDLFSRQQRNGGGRPSRELREQSAKELSLPVVNGHVTLPDFRIEYEDDQGERSRVDIEVATGNYRQAHLAAKVQAGFRIYAPRLAVEQGGYLKGNIFKDRSTTVFAL